MKQTRGLGFVYQPVYVDKRTGERKTAATWWVQYSVRGKRYRESSGSTNRADAVKLLNRRIGEAAEGRPVGRDIEKTRFEDLALILLDDYWANGRQSIRRVLGAIRTLRQVFGDSRAIDITDDRLSSYIVYRQEQGGANATINRELAALKRAFRLAGRKVGQPPRFRIAAREQCTEGLLRAGAVPGRPPASSGPPETRVRGCVHHGMESCVRSAHPEMATRRTREWLVAARSRREQEHRRSHVSTDARTMGHPI